MRRAQGGSSAGRCGTSPALPRNGASPVWGSPGQPRPWRCVCGFSGTWRTPEVSELLICPCGHKVLRYPTKTAQSAASERGTRPQHVLDDSFAVRPSVQGESERIWGRAEPRGCCGTHTCWKAPTQAAETPSAGNTQLLLQHRAWEITPSYKHQERSLGSLAGLGLDLFPTCQQPLNGVHQTQP